MFKKGLFAAFLTLAFAALPALAQDAGPLTISFGDDLLSSQRIFQMVVLLTVLSLAPSILMMVTSFTRIVVVFSFLRNAMGLQSTPPNSVLISLAMFLTLFIMQPTFEAAYEQGVAPYLEGRIMEEEAFDATAEPFHKFMMAQVNESDLDLFISFLPEDERPAPLSENETRLSFEESPEQAIPLKALVPAFMISELRRAFEIGFLIFLPFLIIDLTVASILMSMGMMMLPPVLISMPFKIIFFVLVDGWHLLVGSLLNSFNTP